MKSEETNPAIEEAILEVLDNQIRDRNPPETAETIERLIGEGYTADEARRLVSTAVAVEIFHIMQDHQEFDRKRFLWNLAHLPQEPWNKSGKEYYEYEAKSGPRD